MNSAQTDNYNRVLEWLTEVTGNEVTTLPMGYRYNTYYCSIALVLRTRWPRARVYGHGWHRSPIDHNRVLPQCVRCFIKDFDAGMLPEFDVNIKE